MPHLELARQLFALEHEIMIFQPDPSFESVGSRLERIEEIEGYLAGNPVTHFPTPFEDVFNEASTLLETGPYEGADTSSVRFAYTRTLLSLGKLSMPIGSVVDHGCLQEELLHARSLRWHKYSSQRKPNPDHLPAAVLFDTQGQPFAYQKSLGEPNTAITWRRTTFGTQAGTRIVPADSLIRLVYDDSTETPNEAGPAYAYRGLGLIAIHEKSGPLDVEFIRLTNHKLPPTIREAAFRGGTLQESALLEDHFAATRLTGAKVRRLVFTLLKRGKATTVVA